MAVATLPGILFEKFAVSTVAKTFSLRECTTHAIFHRPADTGPLCTCPFGAIEDGGHLTVTCTDASSVEGDESFSQQQGFARAMQLIVKQHAMWTPRIASRRNVTGAVVLRAPMDCGSHRDLPVLA